MGVQLPGGKLYCWSRSIATLVFVVFMGPVGGAMLFGGARAISPSAGPIALGLEDSRLFSY